MADSIYAVDIVTRDVLGVYDGYVSAAQAYGTTPSRVRAICKSASFPKHLKHTFRYAFEYVMDEKVDSRSPSPVWARRGDRVRTFYNITEAAELLGRSESSIRRYVVDGKGLGLEWGRLDRGLDALIRELEAANGPA